MLNALDLCAGIAGISLGLRRTGGYRTVCYVEKAEYPQKVLRARMRDGHLDDAPLWDDLCTFDGRPWRGVVDIVTAGFPCQPFSNAGARKGSADDRYLWPEVARVIGEVGPRWVLLENVPGLLSIQSGAVFGAVLGSLASLGYCVEWHCVSAADFGAPHIRDRVWIVAHSHDYGRRQVQHEQPGSGCEDVADAQGWQDIRGERGVMAHACGPGESLHPAACPGCTDGRDFPHSHQEHEHPGGSGTGPVCGQRSPEAELSGREQDGVSNANHRRLSEWQGLPVYRERPHPTTEALERWAFEPAVGRVVNGYAGRVDQLKALGNAVVPTCAEYFGRMILQYEEALNGCSTD